MPTSHLPSPTDWPELGRGRMSPRQRVYVALSHREPDRVPVDLWAVPELQQRLCEYFGVTTQDEVLRRLNVDVRWVAPTYIGPQRTLPGGVTVDAYGSWRKDLKHAFGTYNEYAGYPLAEARSAADVDAWDWPRSEYWDVDSVAQQLDALEAEDEYFICYDLGGIFERSWGLLGLERFLIDLATNPEVPCAIMDHMTDLYIANVTRMLEKYEGRIDMVYTWDDIAHQRGLIMSPAMWRQYVLPRHQRLNAVIRKFKVKLMYHSCGAVYPFIPALIHDMGIDVLNPLQPQADGMDLARIKREFGHELCFHGGVDIQHTMPHGSAEDVRAEVRNRCEVLGKSGGYILATAHYMQNDTPMENVLALYRTPRETAAL